MKSASIETSLRKSVLGKVQILKHWLLVILCFFHLCVGPQALINPEEMGKLKELFGAKSQGVDVSASMELFQVHTSAAHCSCHLCRKLSQREPFTSSTGAGTFFWDRVDGLKSQNKNNLNVRGSLMIADCSNLTYLRMDVMIFLDNPVQ